MPDVRRTGTIKVPYTTTSRIAGLRELSGGYEWTGIPEEASPAEIVAVLHRRIAAKSPEHAALVARFERKQREKTTRC